MTKLINGHYPDCPRLRGANADLVCVCLTRAIARKHAAEDAVVALQKALRLTRHAPRTRARVRLALTSAGGALRHAQGLLHRVRDAAP